MDHFRAPRNAGRLPPDAVDVGTGEATDTGAKRVRLQLRVEPDGRVGEARFKAFGCPVTIACASWVTLELTGRTLEEARQLEPGQIGEGLDLRDDQLPLAELTARAIGAAVADLESKLRRAGFQILDPAPR